ncbi:MAG: glycosyltransferase family 4 protein [Bacteroidota bacterium]|nr:glycosyltransferase family 4 protein [Bacteroidota bacterium]
MKSRILFVLHIPPPIHGASVMGQYIRNSELINDGVFENRYINLSTSRQIGEIGKGGIVKLFRFGSILMKIVAELLFHRPDFCYITIAVKGGPFYKDAIIVLLIRLLGVKRVFHLHNKGVLSCQSHFPERFLYPLVFSNASVILLSQQLYPDIARYVPIDRVYYCPNGIPKLDVWQEVNQKNNKVSELLFLSNMISSKGVFVLLDACRILKESGVSFHCTFVGDWGDIEESEFEQYVFRYDLQSYITYAGKKYGEEKAQYLKRADVFVFPTFYDNECFPLVLLESLQYALPVVTTNEGAISEIVEDNRTGFIVPKKDMVALSDKLEYLIRNPSIANEMGRNGQQDFLNKYTLDIFEKNFVKTLHQIVGN